MNFSRSKPWCAKGISKLLRPSVIKLLLKPFARGQQVAFLNSSGNVFVRPIRAVIIAISQKCFPRGRLCTTVTDRLTGYARARHDHTSAPSNIADQILWPISHFMRSRRLLVTFPNIFFESLTLAKWAPTTPSDDCSSKTGLLLLCDSTSNWRILGAQVSICYHCWRVTRQGLKNLRTLFRHIIRSCFRGLPTIGKIFAQIFEYGCSIW